VLQTDHALVFLKGHAAAEVLGLLRAAQAARIFASVSAARINSLPPIYLRC